MKNILTICIFVVTLSSCQNQEKYGYVDNGELINNYQEKLDIEEKYKARETAFGVKTDSISKAFQLEAQDYQIRAQRASASRAQSLYDELGQKQQLLQQQIQFEQQQLQLAYNTEIDSAIIRIKDYVRQYGERNGYTYIFGTSEASSSVMYGKSDNDLTQIILDSLNARYKKKLGRFLVEQTRELNRKIG